MFKERSLKKRPAHDTTCTTLDARHQHMVETWITHQAGRSSLEDLQKQLEQQQRHWQTLIRDKKREETMDAHYDLAWTCNLACGDELRVLKHQLDNLTKCNEEIDYYEQTAHVLFQYYDLLEHQEESATPVAAPRVCRSRKKNPPIMPTRSILDAFAAATANANAKATATANAANAVDLDVANAVADSSSNATNASQAQSPLVPTLDPAKSAHANASAIDKMSLVECYLTLVDPQHVRIQPQEALHECTKCKTPLLCMVQDGIVLCTECGAQELLLVEQNRPIMRQSSKEASHFSYKRINHFNEWVCQAQGKESTNIPEEVFERIITELKKEKIYDSRSITYAKMREILKKLKINKYYEHSNFIINRINGMPTPHFPTELEEKLRTMFKEIQGPFLKHCPKERKNFLSYSYVLYKFLELLERDEYLPFFPLLKSREKLHVQDEIWKNICEERNWQFIKSI